MLLVSVMGNSFEQFVHMVSIECAEDSRCATAYALSSSGELSDNIRATFISHGIGEAAATLLMKGAHTLEGKAVLIPTLLGLSHGSVSADSLVDCHASQRNGLLAIGVLVTAVAVFVAFFVIAASKSSHL